MILNDVTFAAPTSVTQSSAYDVSAMGPKTVTIATVGTATYQVQISPVDTGNVWVNEGAALSASGSVFVEKPCRRIRIDCTAYTNGTPTVYITGIYKASGG